MAEKTQGILVLKLANNGESDILTWALAELGQGITVITAKNYNGVGYAIVRFFVDTTNPTVINGMKNFSVGDEAGTFDRVSTQLAADVFANSNIPLFRDMMQAWREQYLGV